MDLVQSANALIRDALSKGSRPVVAFSGGKDSSVVLHLVRQIMPSIPAVWCNTLVEHPETVKFCRAQSDVVELKPKTTFWKCVEKYGWPMTKAKARTHGNRCCLWLKEKPAEEWYKEHQIDLVFTGLTEGESRNRMMFLKRCGPLYFAKSYSQWRCHPIWNWTETDVWGYLRSNGLKYNPIYDRGAIRCGCMPCTAYKSWKKRLARENPRLLTHVLKMQGQLQLRFDCTGELLV